MVYLKHDIQWRYTILVWFLRMMPITYTGHCVWTFSVDHAVHAVFIYFLFFFFFVFSYYAWWVSSQSNESRVKSRITSLLSNVSYVVSICPGSMWKQREIDLNVCIHEDGMWHFLDMICETRTDVSLLRYIRQEWALPCQDTLDKNGHFPAKTH